MSELTHLTIAFTYLRARATTARHAAKCDERGASAVEWLVIVVLAIGLVGIAGVFITNYLNKKGTELNGTP